VRGARQPRRSVSLFERKRTKHREPLAQWARRLLRLLDRSILHRRSRHRGGFLGRSAAVKFRFSIRGGAETCQ
jgi:hypothetical protein